MPKGTTTPIHIQQEILLRFDAYRREGMDIMAACTRISADLAGREEDRFEIPPRSIWAMLNRLRPTTDMAKMYLKAKAMRLVKRVVAKANVSEAIDILSRPGIDVLSPAQKGVDSSGPAGFFLTVKADTCGAVTVGAMVGPQPVKQLEEAAFDPFTGTIGGFDEAQDTGSGTPQLIGVSETRQTALDRARAKIRAAQEALGSGHVGLQDVDGHAQEEDVTVTP
jgi:hypothetical protein